MREALIPLRGAAVFGMTLAIIGFCFMSHDACHEKKPEQVSDDQDIEMSSIDVEEEVVSQSNTPEMHA